MGIGCGKSGAIRRLGARKSRKCRLCRACRACVAFVALVSRCVHSTIDLTYITKWAIVRLLRIESLHRSSRAGFRYLVRSYFLSEMVVRTGGCRYYLCQAEFSYLALLCILPLDGLGNSRVQVSPFSRRILLLCIPVLSVRNALENQTI